MLLRKKSASLISKQCLEFKKLVRFSLYSSSPSKLLQKDRQLSKRGANSGMAIPPNCSLTTPSLAVVTCSLFCPPQQPSLPSLGRGQRRLCQPEPHAPPCRAPRHRAGACLPACLHTFGAANLLKRLCWKRTFPSHRGITAFDCHTTPTLTT